MLRTALALIACALAVLSAAQSMPRVTSPPESFFKLVRDRDRDVARKFYKKYIDVKGMPVVYRAWSRTPPSSAPTGSSLICSRDGPT